MVSKKKQKRSPKKSAHCEDIYLNDLQVEIKQEEELIIEDADQQHVQWRFIGLDDDVNEDGVDWEGEELQQVYFQNQYDGVNYNRSHNTSFDEVIEISDDGNDTYEEGAGEVIESDACSEVIISNEPLQDSLVETNGLHTESSSNIRANDETTSASENSDIGEDGTASSGKVINVKNAEDTQNHKSIYSINEGVLINNKQASDNVDCLNVGPMNEWMCRKLIKMCCHICGTTFQHNVYSWLSHMKQLHPKSLREIQSKYNPHSDIVVICKLCKMQVTPKINHTLHYITRHLEPKPQIFLCTFCNYTDFSLMTLQKHQVEKHPSVIRKREKCPKCDESFKDDTALEYHFMSVHIREFNAKHVYKCHLCDSSNFESSKNKLYGHLMDKHKLANWKILNFRKIENGAYLSCMKCYKIFVKTNVQHLLGHYLTHEEKSTWSCKFCKRTNHFKDWPVPHLCQAMRKFYDEKFRSAGNDSVNGVSNEGQPNEESIPEQQQQKSVSWNEFEAYIEHVCPFCNEGFNKFEDWRLHVREVHHIHTLEGLNMTITPDETDKLLCLQCNTLVTKSAVELHKHRFQHLPYEPYKCRHCAKCLPTYNKALCHVQKSCQDNDGRSGKPMSIQSISKSESVTPQEAAAVISISCTLCNNKKFANFSQMTKHISNVHDNFDKYFTKANKERSRTCKICQNDMKRNKLNELIGHYLQHLNERPFKCQKCLRSYPTFRIAVKHVQSYHLDITTADIKEYIQNTGIKQELEPNPYTRSNPVTPIPALPPPPISLPTPIPPPTPIPRPLPTTPKYDSTSLHVPACAFETCGLHVVEYTHHVFKTYERFITYACPECNEPFSTSSKWEVHVTSKHAFYKGSGLHTVDIGKGKSKCIDCNIIVSNILSKQQNHKLTHMPYRAFICALCLGHFTAVATLYKHFRNAHFCEGSFLCDLCPKTLSTDFERLKHVKKVHPSTKWPNNMCTTCFKIIDDMDGHLLTNHLTHQRKYRCENCGVYFEYSKELEIHIAKMHSSTNEVAVNGSSSEKSRTVSRLGKRKLCRLSSDGNTHNAKKPYSSSIQPIQSGRK